MNNRKSIITLKDYLAKAKTFVIPDYQRGYVWGKSRKVNNKGDKDSVTYMLESIHDGFHQDIPIFIQGVTVNEERDKITIIDGQQRTTFFYLLLCYLQFSDKIKIEYLVRTDSQSFLSSIYNKKVEDIVNICKEISNEKYQDIYYFKKTIRLIDENIKRWGIQTEKLKDYLLNNIQFLYIDIPENKARTVFRMMNGNKANMSDEDLVKAEILRLISLDTDDNELLRREQDLLRSRYAREWDRWLRWWNQTKVLAFYKSTEKKHPLTLLLSTYHQSVLKNKKEDFNFENFRTRFILTVEDARKTFNGLRHLQKRFEDTFNDIKIETHHHNLIGGILTVLSKENAMNFIYDYFTSIMSDEVLKNIYKLSFLGNLKFSIICKKSKGEQLSEDEEDEYAQAQLTLKEAINSNDMYNISDYKEIAFRQLLLLNIEHDSYLGRMFNFSAYEHRSIEHIFPKSKVYRDNGGNHLSCEDGKVVTIDENWINYDDLIANDCSQHCIGNFALLYMVNNSKLGNKSFAEKKTILFGTKNTDDVDVFQSRELLHTISLFAFEKWGVEEISENKKRVIEKLEKYYGIQ